MQHVIQAADFFATTRIQRHSFHRFNNTADNKHQTRSRSGVFSGVNSFLFGRNERRSRLTAQSRARFRRLHFVPTKGISNSMSRRRRFSRKRKRGRGFGRMALRKVRKLEQKIETKVFQTPFTTIADVTVGTGNIRSMLDLAQGLTQTTRIGNNISPTSFVFRFQWVGQALGVNGLYRTLIFQDRRQVASTAPTILQVLNDERPLAQFNPVFKGRFKILYDSMFTGVSDSDFRQSFAGIVTRRMTGVIKWNGASGTSYLKNNIYMINVTNTTVNDPSLHYTFLFKYKDA